MFLTSVLNQSHRRIQRRLRILGLGHLQREPPPIGRQQPCPRLERLQLQPLQIEHRQRHLLRPQLEHRQSDLPRRARSQPLHGDLHFARVILCFFLHDRGPRQRNELIFGMDGGAAAGAVGMPSVAVAVGVLSVAVGTLLMAFGVFLVAVGTRLMAFEVLFVASGTLRLAFGVVWGPSGRAGGVFAMRLYRGCAFLCDDDVDAEAGVGEELEIPGF
mmetsp:Transcript_24623/g.61504  ORF Transcript_24623/g.61504 Transcript_24623/m.61504 type:complete len:216 (+) Transcript_24623:1579-2226(+)